MNTADRPKKQKPQWALGRPWGPHTIEPPAADLPFIFVNVAMTADGKIAPANRNFEPFSSRADRLLMLELRSYADAIMSGARTIDLNPVTLSNGGPRFTALRRARGLAEHPFRVVVSGHGTLDPHAEIFKHRFSPIILLTTERAPARRLRKLRGLADAVGVFGRDQLDFTAACRWLRQELGVRTLLCEGGGEVNAGLIEAGLVDEMYLTLCPVIFGGREAPTVVDGQGVASLNEAARMELRAGTQLGDELFLIYRRAAKGTQARA